MTDSAVIGLGFGDEGKGLVTNSLCNHYPDDSLVVRYSGGQQAGHTVVFPNGTRHIFSNFGSGSSQEVPTYWSKFCTLDPDGIVKELGVLETKGVKPILLIDRDCPITTPFEKKANTLNSQYISDGTCGAGVGTTWQREKDLFSITAKDMLYPKILKIKLKMLQRYYGFTIHANTLATWVFTIEHMLGHDHIKIIRGLPLAYHYIFEGSQGLMLDQDIGFYPHVTWGNTGTKNIYPMISKHPNLYLVTRAYQTRHGNGPMTNESLPTDFKHYPMETNIDHPYQGELRKTILDADLLKYAIDSDKGINTNPRKTLIITCCDQIDGEFKFTMDNKIWPFTNINRFAEVLTKHLGIPEYILIDNPAEVFI